jgi:hypothetical protein
MTRDDDASTAKKMETTTTTTIEAARRHPVGNRCSHIHLSTIIPPLERTHARTHERVTNYKERTVEIGGAKTKKRGD